MRRRDLIALLGSAATWPLAAYAQQAGRIWRIGLLMLVAEIDPQAQAELTAFATELRHLG